MNDRTRLAIGGGAVALASVAVVVSVAASNAAALTDVAGTPSGSSGVVVPAAPASPTPSSPPADSPAAAPVPAPGAEAGAITVPAPDPAIVAPPAEASAPSDADDDAWVAASDATGSWDEARAWAAERGWDAAKIHAWIARLQAKLERSAQNDRGAPDAQLSETSKTSADADKNVAPASENGGGAMKGRSHSSPDSRD